MEHTTDFLYRKIGMELSPFRLAQVFLQDLTKNAVKLNFKCRRHSRKRLVVSQRRYECACKRIDDANVTFCEEGGSAARANSDFLQKNQSSLYIACSDVEKSNNLDI